MFERILVPLDGSDEAEGILGKLEPILRRQESELLVVHAYDPVVLAAGRFVVPTSPKVLAEEAWAYAKGRARALRESGTRARGLARAGPAAEVIVAVAREKEASLIALSTHARTGLSRLLRRSVASQVLSRSEVPCLISRSYGLANASRDGRMVERIVVAVDGTEESLSILKPASDLARFCEARMLLLHLSLSGMPAREAEDRVARSESELTSQGIKVEAQARQGDAVSVILTTCAGRPGDVIALSAPSYRRFGLWGSTTLAERVLYSSATPLLVNRSHSKPAA